MAGKLSHFARRGCWFFAAAFWPAVTAITFAQEGLRVSSNANVFENPYAENPPHRDAGAQVDSAGTRRTSIRVHNPFAKLAKAPPVAPPIRSGPISRWRRRASLAEEPSALRVALLTTDVNAEKRVPWNELPTDEQLQTSLFGRVSQASTGADAQINQPPDPINFAPKPLTQPSWLVLDDPEVRPLPPVNSSSPRVGVSIDTIDVTDTTAIARVAAPIAGAMNAAGSPREDGPPGEIPTDADWLPIIVSDQVDTPDDCFNHAQDIAKAAESVDQLTIVIEYCQRGLAGVPPSELAISLRRLAAWAHNRRGELRSDAREQHDAMSDFQDAIRLDPKCWSALHNRGITLAQQDQTSAALRDFDRVLELNPGLTIAWRNRAELLASLGRMDEAIRDYTQALAQRPEDADLYRARGYAWQRVGAYDEALADLNRSLGLLPDQADVYTQRGNLSAELGNFDRALSNYQQALRIDSGWGEAHRCLAWFLSTCPDPAFRDQERALTEADQAAKLASQADYFVLDTLAAAHANAAQFAEAVRFEQGAIALAPPDVVAPFEERLALYQRSEPFRSRIVAEMQPAVREAAATDSVPSR
jgi:tetratricopeptide (TPR) repeat protein